MNLEKIEKNDRSEVGGSTQIGISGLSACHYGDKKKEEDKDLKETLKQIAHIILPYQSSLKNEPKKDEDKDSFSSYEDLPEILVEVLRDWEELKRVHQRQSIIFTEYEDLVGRYFQLYGERNPPSTKLEEQKLLECSDTEFHKSQGKADPISIFDEIQPSLWFNNLLKKMWEAIEEGVSSLVFFDSNPIPEESTINGVGYQTLDQLKKNFTEATKVVTVSSENVDTEGSHRRIETIFQTAIDWITAVSKLIQIEGGKRGEQKEISARELEAKMRLKIRCLEEQLQKGGSSQKDVDERGLNLNSQNTLLHLWNQVEELYEAVGEQQKLILKQETHSRTEQLVESDALHDLQIEKQEAMEALSQLLVGLGGGRIKFSQAEENHFNRTTGRLSDFVSVVAEQWNSLVAAHSKKEQGLQEKIRKGDNIRRILEAHGTETRDMNKTASQGKHTSETTDEMVHEVSAKNSFSHSFVPLPEHFNESELEAHLTAWRTKCSTLERQKIQLQCDVSAQKVLGESLTKQVASLNKSLEQCSRQIVEMAPLLGLEDDISILRRRDEPKSFSLSVTSTVESLNDPGSPRKNKQGASSGSAVVAALRAVAHRLQQREGKSLGDIAPTSPASPASPASLPPLPPSHPGRHVSEGSRRGHPTNRYSGDPGDAEEFREALKVVLHRLLESGKCIKQTLFVLGTDETAGDDLLEDLSEMFSEGIEGFSTRRKRKKNPKKGPDDVDEPNDGEREEEVMERLLAVLLQKYSRWTKRLQDTVQDHLIAQQRYTKYFTAVLRFFDDDRSVETSRSETDLLHRIVVSIGGQPLDNLIDVDCILLDGMEVLLPLLEAKVRERRGGLKPHKNEGEDSAPPNIPSKWSPSKPPLPFPSARSKESSAFGAGSEDGAGSQPEEVSELGITAPENSAKPVEGKEEDSREEDKVQHGHSLSVLGEELRGSPLEGDNDGALYDRRLGQLYLDIQDIHRLVSGLLHVHYFTLPPRSSREESGPTQDRFIDASLEDLMYTTPSAGWNTAKSPDTGDGDAEKATCSVPSAGVVALRESNNHTLYRVLSHNIQELQQLLRFFSHQFKEVAILVRRDMDALQQQVAQMIADWSTVNVEEQCFGQDREKLRRLHGLLKEQGTVCKGRYVLSRQLPEGWEEGASATARSPSVSPSSLTVAVWQAALEMLGDGLHKLILVFAKQEETYRAEMEALEELSDVGAMYVNWVEREGLVEAGDVPPARDVERKGTKCFDGFPLLPARVLEHCVREGDSTSSPLSGGAASSSTSMPSLPDKSEPSLHVSATTSAASNQRKKVSHFMAHDTLTEVVTHMFQLARESWEKLQERQQEEPKAAPLLAREPTGPSSTAAVLTLPAASEKLPVNPSGEAKRPAPSSSSCQTPPAGPSRLLPTGGLYVPLPPGSPPPSTCWPVGGPSVSLALPRHGDPFALPVSDISLASLFPDHTDAERLSSGFPITGVGAEPQWPARRTSPCRAIAPLETPFSLWNTPPSIQQHDESQERLQERLQELQQERDIALSEAAKFRIHCRQLEQDLQSSSVEPTRTPTPGRKEKIPPSTVPSKGRVKRVNQKPSSGRTSPPHSMDSKNGAPPMATIPRGREQPKRTPTLVRAPRGGQPGDPKSQPSRRRPTAKEVSDEGNAPEQSEEEETPEVHPAALREVLRYLQATLHPDRSPAPEEEDPVPSTRTSTRRASHSTSLVTPERELPSAGVDIFPQTTAFGRTRSPPLPLSSASSSILLSTACSRQRSAAAGASSRGPNSKNAAVPKTTRGRAVRVSREAAPEESRTAPSAALTEEEAIRARLRVEYRQSLLQPEERRALMQSLRLEEAQATTPQPFSEERGKWVRSDPASAREDDGFEEPEAVETARRGRPFYETEQSSLPTRSRGVENWEDGATAYGGPAPPGGDHECLFSTRSSRLRIGLHHPQLSETERPAPPRRGVSAERVPGTLHTQRHPFDAGESWSSPSPYRGGGSLSRRQEALEREVSAVWGGGEREAEQTTHSPSLQSRKATSPHQLSPSQQRRVWVGVPPREEEGGMWPARRPRYRSDSPDGDRGGTSWWNQKGARNLPLSFSQTTPYPARCGGNEEEMGVATPYFASRAAYPAAASLSRPSHEMGLTRKPQRRAAGSDGSSCMQQLAELVEAYRQGKGPLKSTKEEIGFEKRGEDRERRRRRTPVKGRPGAEGPRESNTPARHHQRTR